MAKAKKVFIMFAAGLVLAAAVWAEPDVYVAEFEETANDKIACYWKNGVQTALTRSGDAGALAIAVSGSSVCVAGYESNAAHIAMAAYWKNGVKTVLTGGETYAYACGIAFGDLK